MAKNSGDEVTLTILGDIPLAYKTEALKGIKGTEWENFAFTHLKSGDKAPTPNDLVHVFARHVINAAKKADVPLSDFFKTFIPNPNITSAHVDMRDAIRSGKVSGTKAYMTVNSAGTSGSVKMYASHSSSLMGGTEVSDKSHLGNNNSAPNVSNLIKSKPLGVLDLNSNPGLQQHNIFAGGLSENHLGMSKQAIARQKKLAASSTLSAFMDSSAEMYQATLGIHGSGYNGPKLGRGAIPLSVEELRDVRYADRGVLVDGVNRVRGENPLYPKPSVKDPGIFESSFRHKNTRYETISPKMHGPDATLHQLYPKAMGYSIRGTGSMSSVEEVSGNTRARTSPQSSRSILHGVVGGRGELLSDTGPMSSGAEFSPSKPVLYDARQYGAREIREGGTTHSSRSWGVMEAEKGRNLIKETVEALRSKPGEGTVADAIQKISGKRGGGSGLIGSVAGMYGGASNQGDGQGGARRGGLSGQIKEQFRHAAIWQGYAPVLGAIGAVAAAPLVPFSTKAAGELVGLGATREQQHAALKIHGGANALDSFRRTDEAISSSKKLLAAVGWSPTVANQLKAAHLGNTINYVSKAADIDPEALTQISVRTAQMFGSGKYGEQEHISKILGALYKSGAMTSVKGPELAQTLSQGGAAFSQLFGDAGKAIAYSVPFIQAGVPNVGRAVQHQTSGEVQDKMARAQLLAEINYANMEKYGDNTKNVIGEDHLTHMLGFKTVNKQRVPRNPELQQRLQATKQRISEQMHDTMSNYALHAKYGSHLAWGEKYGVKIPRTDQVHARFSMAAMALMSPEQIDSTLGIYNTTQGGFDNNLATADVKEARGIKNAATDAHASWQEVTGYLSDQPTFNNIFGALRASLAASRLRGEVVASIKQKDPEERRAMLHGNVLAIKEQLAQGHISDWDFRHLKTDDRSAEGYVNAMLKSRLPNEYEAYKIVGEVEGPYDMKGYDPSAQGNGWRGGNRDEYNWDQVPDDIVGKRKYLEEQKKAAFNARRKSDVVSHSMDPYELPYLTSGSGINPGIVDRKADDSFIRNMSTGESLSSGNISGTVSGAAAPIISAILKLAEELKQGFTNLPAPSVSVTVSQDGNKKAETTSSTTPAHFGVHPSGI